MNWIFFYRFLRGYAHFFFSWKGLPVKRQDLVADIGSGDNPNIRADILCDLYPESNDERSGRFGIWVDERPFILCDIHQLPFRDKAFDYIICSHLLEHVADPQRAVQELTRVGRRGRIETPSQLFEILYGWSFHRWRVARDGKGRLIFEGKDISVTGLLSEPIKKSREFEKLVSKFPSEFLVKFEWEGTFPVEVRGKGVSSVNKKSPDPNEIFLEKILQRTLRRKIKIFLIGAIRRCVSSHSSITLSDLLCCPKCHGALLKESEGFVCKTCPQHFPERNGIFFFYDKTK